MSAGPGGGPPNYITPAGFAKLREDHRRLFEVERPKVVEVVSWAAGNGDRSENGDYIYGRKRLREIDKALNRLSARMKDAVIVDPTAQPDKARAFFGATVTYVDDADRERVVTIVGQDETDAERGLISWQSPIARALNGARIGDVRVVQLPAGAQEVEVTAIAYPAKA
jgi:transcription elongation factor GreB